MPSDSKKKKSHRKRSRSRSSDRKKKSSHKSRKRNRSRSRSKSRSLSRERKKDSKREKVAEGSRKKNEEKDAKKKSENEAKAAEQAEKQRQRREKMRLWAEAKKKKSAQTSFSGSLVLKTKSAGAFKMGGLKGKGMMKSKPLKKLGAISGFGVDTESSKMTLPTGSFDDEAPIPPAKDELELEENASNSKEENGKSGNAGKSGTKMENTGGDDAEDALDAFMSNLDTKKKKKKKTYENSERFYADDEVHDEEDFEDEDSAKPSWLQKQEKKAKGKDLKQVDHSKMDYQPFKKNFYIEAKDITNLTDEEVKKIRDETLEGVKIRGKNCPRPILKWVQCGLPRKVYAVIEKQGFKTPFPIQMQALPAIMSGRDVIACAKTGSGKTLAFILPMLRHIMDQPPLQKIDGLLDGPIGIILAPTRELAVQIHSDVRRFARVLDLRCVCVYGGAGVAQQISSLKAGAEIIVATPGRFIDILCANSGRVTNLRRVTFVVLDEADRMFDMGFAPQIMKVVENTRPDRQTVMFSATFPKAVENLAKQALKAPLEIVIGGRAAASGTIKQFIEVREEGTKFRRLLEILGQWYSKGNILIFVDKQESVDNLFRELISSGYPCLALHGGMDQNDRDYTITDFKGKLRTVMVATSVVARGLDVKDLVLVVNYTVPNHYEDYVHRVGRTGRAGKEGTAITFLCPSEERYAPELVKGLKESKGQIIPQDLQNLADSWSAKRKSGQVSYGSNSGYGGSGFKFDAKEDSESRTEARAIRAQDLPDQEDTESALEKAKTLMQEKAQAKADKSKESSEKKAAAAAVAALSAAPSPKPVLSGISAQLAAAKAAAAAAASAINTTSGAAGVLAAHAAVHSIVAKANAPAVDAAAGAAAAKAFAVALSIKQQLAANMTAPSWAVPAAANSVNPGYHSCQVEINDYPQHARWKITHKQTINQIMDMVGEVSIITKGMYVPEGRKAQPGEQKLYLLVEGKTEMVVSAAKNEIVRIIEQAAENAKPEKNRYGKYAVLGS